MFKTKETLLMAINRCLPYPDQIKELDFTTEETTIKFVWRGTKFKIGINGSVGEIGDGVLIGSDVCILLRELLKRQWVSENI